MPKKLMPDEARRTTQNYRCAQCWGRLIERYIPAERLSEVSCTTPGCPSDGFVTTGYVERARSEGVALEWQARKDLQDAGVIQKIIKTEDEVKAALGL